MGKVIHRMTVDLQGLKKWSWHENLRGFFSINGEKLEDAEVRELVDWAIKKDIKQIVIFLTKKQSPCCNKEKKGYVNRISN